MMCTVFQLRGLFAAALLASCGGAAPTPPPVTEASGWAVEAPIVHVSDVDAAFEYYCSELKFRCDPALKFPGVRPEEGSIYAIVEREGIEVHLQIRRTPQPPREAHEVDFIVSVRDARVLFSEFKEQRIKFVRLLAPTPWGSREFTIEDPFGNRATFTSKLEAHETSQARNG